MSIKVDIAKTKKQFEAGSQLFRAYAKYLGLDLEFQGFSEELMSLSKIYGEPKGALLLAKLEGTYIGAVGLREFEPGIAEIKRMYVLPNHHGMGVGKALTEASLKQATEMGYCSIRLDSIRALDKALQLYRYYGFEEIEPYRFNPHPEAVFMEYKIP
ncbi:MAG: N-acetyltransferase [Piscirickettsiaceae bacterium CG_4_9_14_3_um_filter_43_564]|nr:GNAT family N-acetyltransferase [Thiomicrospira sp.]NCN67365.1 GNAT family N-acetyltransferase [Thiomicrospira sp.]NCO13605.1 GNAT family N-acetyltransferase [Thiomicrospira sp.]PJA66164.1 MAG: N-acetyltransferase [Piscirickettsiaceae bacterium CG_4_9_14_3_um_filter_43_564]